MGVIVATLVLALLLVFILQNTKSVRISYFTAHGAMPLGVALLLATVGGVLLAGTVASLRIWQLRHRLKNPDQPIPDLPPRTDRIPPRAGGEHLKHQRVEAPAKGAST